MSWMASDSAFREICWMHERDNFFSRRGDRRVAEENGLCWQTLETLLLHLICTQLQWTFFVTVKLYCKAICQANSDSHSYNQQVQAQFVLILEKWHSSHGKACERNEPCIVQLIHFQCREMLFKVGKRGPFKFNHLMTCFCTHFT